MLSQFVIMNNTYITSTQASEDIQDMTLKCELCLYQSESGCYNINPSSCTSPKMQLPNWKSFRCGEHVINHLTDLTFQLLNIGNIHNFSQKEKPQKQSFLHFRTHTHTHIYRHTQQWVRFNFDMDFYQSHGSPLGSGQMYGFTHYDVSHYALWVMLGLFLDLWFPINKWALNDFRILGCMIEFLDLNLCEYLCLYTLEHVIHVNVS